MSHPFPARSVGRRVARINHPRGNPVEACALAWGIQPSSAAQRLKLTAPECPWSQAALGTEALIRAGHPVRAEALCLPLDLVRVTLGEPATVEAFDRARETEAIRDGEEDVAQQFIRDRASFETWEKRTLAHIAAALRAVKIGRAVYGRVA
jgi:hypothetical protein